MLNVIFHTFPPLGSFSICLFLTKRLELVCMYVCVYERERETLLAFFCPEQTEPITTLMTGPKRGEQPVGPLSSTKPRTYGKAIKRQKREEPSPLGPHQGGLHVRRKSRTRPVPDFRPRPNLFWVFWTPGREQCVKRLDDTAPMREVFSYGALYAALLGT